MLFVEFERPSDLTTLVYNVRRLYGSVYSTDVNPIAVIQKRTNKRRMYL